MTVDLVLRNAKVFACGEVVEAGLAIDDDRIAKIAKEPNLPSASEKTDLHGLLILPGLVDAHVHLRDQELEYKEDFYTGTASAANGGVTLAVDMPNNKPVTMDARTLKERMNIASKKTVVNVAFYSAFPEKIEEIGDIVQVGAKAFKLFMSQRIGGLNPYDDEPLLNAFRETARLGVPVAVHAEDGSLIEKASATMKERGRNSIDAYSEAHSPEAEVNAVSRIINITEKSNAHAHICHVSTGEGTDIVSSAKKVGVPITFEVTPHHLLLSSRDARRMGALALTDPPLRSEGNVDSLWSALNGGLIDILVSDHAPHAEEEKRRASVWEVAPGISGIETLLPLMLTQVDRGRLPLSRLVQMTSERPAEIFGIRNRGCLKEGNYADLVVVDLKEEWRIDPSKFYSKAKYSPFDGWQVKGKPVKTFVNGLLVMDDGEIVAKPGDGRVIR